MKQQPVNRQHAPIAAELRLRASKTLLRWAEVLTGPRRHLAVLAALGSYAAIWCLFRAIARHPRGIHFDMSELYAWARAPAWGYDKHPPLSAFVVNAWFVVFPVEDWAFTLLAAVNIAASLYVAWVILIRWTDPFKAAFGLALLAMIPFYNFRGLTYNANTVLLPVWAFTAYAFLRAYESRSAAWSILAGAGAGAAMLGKYWSVFLVAGLISAALIDRRRGRFFGSAAPYLMAAAGMAVLAPHVIWLIENKDTLAYATARVGAGTGSLRNSIKYTLGSIAWIVAALAMWGILIRPRWQAIRDTLVPADEQRRLALWAFLLPNMLPVTVAVAASIEITPIWTLPGYTLLPLVLLSSPLIEVTKEALSRAIGAAAAVTFTLLLCSPTIALVTHLTAKPHSADYAWMLTHDVQARWRATTERPITTVFSCGPDREVAAAVGWNLGVPTRMLYGRPGISARADLLSQGGIIVGAATDPECQEQRAISRLRKRSYLMLPTYRPRLFGIAGRSYSYFAMIVPPETDAANEGRSTSTD